MVEERDSFGKGIMEDLKKRNFIKISRETLLVLYIHTLGNLEEGKYI